jgi:hypothetical protein
MHACHLQAAFSVPAQPGHPAEAAPGTGGCDAGAVLPAGMHVLFGTDLTASHADDRSFVRGANCIGSMRRHGTQQRERARLNPLLLHAVQYPACKKMLAIQ